MSLSFLDNFGINRALHSCGFMPGVQEATSGSRLDLVRFQANNLLGRHV